MRRPTSCITQLTNSCFPFSWLTDGISRGWHARNEKATEDDKAIAEQWGSAGHLIAAANGTDGARQRRQPSYMRIG